MMRNYLLPLALLLSSCGSPASGTRNPALQKVHHLPPQTTLVAGLSVRALKDSPLYLTGHKLLMNELREKQPRMIEFMEAVKLRCDLDPFRDIEWGLAVAGESVEDEFVVLLGGTFTEEKFASCAASFGWERETKGPVNFYNEAELYMAWPSSNVMALAFEGDALGFLMQIADGTGTGPSEQMASMIEATNTAATFWAVAGAMDTKHSLYRELDLDELTELETFPQAGSLSIDVKKGVELRGQLRFAAEADAGRVAGDWLKLLLEATARTPLSYYLGGVDIHAERTATLARLHLDDKQTQSLLTLTESTLAAERENERRWNEQYEQEEKQRLAEEEQQERAKEQTLAEEAERQRIAQLAERLRQAGEEQRLRQAEEAKSQAKAHSDQGRAFLDAGVYDKAVEEFKAANALVPLPDFLYNIAFSYDNQRGHEQDALSYYESYLRAAPTGTMAEVSRRRVAKITAKLRKN